MKRLRRHLTLYPLVEWIALRLPERRDAVASEGKHPPECER